MSRKSAITDLENKLEQHRYQLVIDELNAAVFEWNLKTGEFYRSPAYYQYAMSTVNSDDILHNKGPLDVVHPDDIPILQKFFEDTQKGIRRADVTLRAKMVDGTYHWCHIIGFYFKDEHGVPSRTVGVVLDINADRERELVMNSLLNELPGGVAVFRITDALECQYFNDGFAKISNRTREEVEELIRDGRLFEKTVALSDQKSFMETIFEAAGKKKPINKVYRYLNIDGTMEWLHLSAIMIREDNGYPVYYCVFTTPTEESQLYRGVVEESAIGVLVAERSTRRVIYMNEALYQIYGISSAEVDADSKFTDVVPNKKLLLTQDEVDKLREDSYTEFHITYDKDLYLSIRGKALKWNGSDAYIIYVTDESEEHSKQLELQELVDHIPGGIGIFELYDDKAHLKYLNNSFYELISVKRESRKYETDTDFFANVYHNDYPVLQNAIVMRYPSFYGKLEKKQEVAEDISILKGKRILLCEDHPLNARIAIQILSKEDMLVDHAEDGKQGVELFMESKQGLYDAVLMDIRMPVMNGLEAARAIRALDREDAKSVPIIAMTANAYDEDVKKSLEAGMNEHMAKPISPKLLYETLAKFIKNRYLA